MADDEEPRETRSEKKRRATAVERVGERLVKLDDASLARIPMPDDLKAAVVEARRIRAHGGYRRQIQYIGKIMRGLDARPIVDALAGLDAANATVSAAHKEAERWRDRLVAEGLPALDALLLEKPTADRAALAKLMRQKASRAIFRELRGQFR